MNGVSYVTRITKGKDEVDGLFKKSDKVDEITNANNEPEFKAVTLSDQA